MQTNEKTTTITLKPACDSEMSLLVEMAHIRNTNCAIDKSPTTILPYLGDPGTNINILA